MGHYISLDLLRHGQCEGGEIFRGHSDVALSEEGWRQMRQAIVGDAPNWDKIICSPLQRCAHFAKEVVQSSGSILSSEAAFKEINFGDWEGQLRENLWKDQAQELSRFYENPLSSSAPNGEGLQDFYQRVIEGLRSLLIETKDNSVLLVSHGGTMRAILCWALGMPLNNFFNIDVPYACLSRLKIYCEGDSLQPSLLAHNSSY